MEKQYEEDTVLKDAFGVAGTEIPPKSFKLDVMKAIAESQKPVSVVPLISAKAWGLLISIFVVSSGLLYFFPIEKTYFSNTFKTSFEGFNEMVSSFKISSGTWYACVFLALFLVQIPFLKHYLEKQRF